jgi:hypothetical protein
MSEDRVLVSSGRQNPHCYHRQLGETQFSVCARLEPDADPDLVTVAEAKARGLKRCSLCPFPELGQVATDGGAP